MRRVRLRAQCPARPRHFSFHGPVGKGLHVDAGGPAGFHQGRIHLRHVDKDANHVGACDRQERLGGGGAGRLNEIAPHHVPLGYHPGIRGPDSRIVEQGLLTSHVGLGILQPGAGESLVGLGLHDAGLALDERRLGRFHLRTGLAARRLGGLQRIPRLVLQLAVQRTARHELADASELRLPAGVVGLGADVARLGLANLGPGGGNRSLRGMDRRNRLLDPRLRLDDLRLLLVKFLFQLGQPQFHQQLIGLDAVADVHVQLLNVGRQFRPQWRLLEGLDPTGLHALAAERLSHRRRGDDRHASRRIRICRRRPVATGICTQACG